MNTFLFLYKSLPFVQYPFRHRYYHLPLPDIFVLITLAFHAPSSTIYAVVIHGKSCKEGIESEPFKQQQKKAFTEPSSKQEYI